MSAARNELIDMVFTADRFLEVAVESYIIYYIYIYAKVHTYSSTGTYTSLLKLLTLILS